MFYAFFYYNINSGVDIVFYNNKLINNETFYKIFCLINTLIVFILYAINKEVVMHYLFISTGLMLLLTNQVKYIVNSFIMFTMSASASISNLGLLLCSLSFLIITIIIYFVVNKPRIKIKQHGIIMFLLAISTFIPIFWYESVDTLHDVYIITYTFYIVFFIIYLLFKSSKQSLLKALIINASYVPILLMLELVLYFFTVPNTNFEGGIFLGWAGGNHASMMILLTFPFVMYRFYTERKLVPIILIICSIVSISLGFSRAGYLFFMLELTIFLLYSIYHYKDKYIIKNTVSLITKHKMISFIIFLIVILISILIILFIPNKKELLFTIFDDNGRLEVYKKGIGLLFENIRNFLFGKGLVSGYILYSGVFLLFHNTFIQALVTGGIIMFIIFFIHFLQKYIFFRNESNVLTHCLLVCFVITDLYGLTDTTYFSSYFTIVFTLILVCLEDNEDEILKLNSPK